MKMGAILWKGGLPDFCHGLRAFRAFSAYYSYVVMTFDSIGFYNESVRRAGKVSLSTSFVQRRLSERQIISMFLGETMVIMLFGILRFMTLRSIRQNFKFAIRLR